MILTKILGAGCILFGFFMVVYFPDASDYQPSNMTFGGVIIGILAILLGIYLIRV